MASNRARFLRFSFEHDTIVEISDAAEVVVVNMDTAEIVQVDMVPETLLCLPSAMGRYLVVEFHLNP